MKFTSFKELKTTISKKISNFIYATLDKNAIRKIFVKK